MRHQDQGDVHVVIQVQVLLSRGRMPLGGGRNDLGHTFHVTQQALHHLFEITLAFTQIRVIHFIELPGHHIELRGQGPLGVVQTITHPVRHAIGQHLVLQQHQMHFQDGGQFGRRILGQGVMQLLQLIFHGIARCAQALQLGAHFFGRNEIVRHIHTARSHQHSTPNGDAACNCEAVDGKRHGRTLFAFTKLVIDQGQQSVHGFMFALALGFHLDLRANAGGQHHDAHDAFGVDATLALADPHLTGKTASELGEFG